MEYLEKLKVYGDQVKNVMVKSMVDTAHGGQKMLKDVLPGNLVTREFEVRSENASATNRWRCFLFAARATSGLGRSRLTLANLWSDQANDEAGLSIFFWQ